MTKWNRAACIALGTVGAVAWTANASAQAVVVQQPAPAAAPVQTAPAERETVTQKGGPSRPMLSSGLVTFGVSYGIAAVVGLSSDRDSDHRMVIPFAGPWIALAQRDDCGADREFSCDNETTEKVLIATDGVFQALGGLLIIGSFLNPETRTVSRNVARQPDFHIVVGPAIGKSSLGLTARGMF